MPTRRGTTSGVIVFCCMVTVASHAWGDCNGNGADDGVDIAEGVSADCNADGVPDECQAAPLPYETLSGLALGGASRAVAVGDLDGDGVDDLGVGVLRSDLDPQVRGRVLLFFADGDDRFSSLDAAVGGDASLVTLLDADGDGDRDIALSAGGALRWLESAGAREYRLHPGVGYKASGIVGLIGANLDGSDGDEWVVVREAAREVVVAAADGMDVSVRATHVLAARPRDAAVVDLDLDGSLDLVAVGRSSEQLSVLYGDGGGGLLDERTEGGVAGRPEALAVLDLDGDGWPEVATAGRDEVVITRIRAGAPGEAETFHFSRLLASGLEAADVDRDGDRDLVVARPTDQPVIVLRNDGQRLVSSQALLAQTPVLAVRPGDFDGDGDVDLALLPLRLGVLNILWRGESRGIPLTRFDRAGTVPLGFQPHSGDVGDLNADGALDVVAVDGDSGVYVLPGDGRGGFRAPWAAAGATRGGLFSVVAVDFEGDGDLDVASVSDSDNSLHTFINEGVDRLRTGARHRVGATPVIIASADTTGDGFEELISVDPSSGTLSLLVNRRDGTFEDARLLRVGGEPRSVASGDFDDDGDVDLFAVLVRNSELLQLENDGTGELAEGIALRVDRPRFVVSLDSDLDGDPDLTAASRAPNRLVRFENGGGRLEAVQEIPLANAPHSAIAADVNGDGLPDIVAASPENDAISIALNQPDGRLTSAIALDVGVAPRFAVAGSFDGGPAEAIVSLNHDSEDATVISDRRVGGPGYLEVLCTGADFHALSVPAPRSALVERLTKYIVPADPDDPSLLPPLFQNVRVHALHEDFLASHFADRFPVELYDALVNRRESRRYFSGAIHRLRTAGGTAYGFNVLANFVADPRELPTPTEVSLVHKQLAAVFQLRPLGYFPATRLAREAVALWPDVGFPVFLDEEDTDVRYEAYTPGESYGRLRVLDAEGFAEANRDGRLTFQDILVLDEAPRDIEGVVGGVITGQRQGELSHIALRLGRRGTPNAFLADAYQEFEARAGRLVRLRVGLEQLEVEDATEEDAALFWSQNRPRLTTLPVVDREYRTLDSLAEMRLDEDSSPASRYGGKASNLARLQPLIAARYVEPGFSIPVAWSIDFLEENTMDSAFADGTRLSYAEHLRRMLEHPRFQSDSAYRFEMLRAFREELRTNGAVDPLLVARVGERLLDVFDSVSTMVRFRSSSNVEDRLEFNGAGLYESTSACLEDSFDGDNDGPSRCDGGQPSERSVERALKKVWASLWTFRAHEERAFFGIPQDVAAMGVLVTRRFEAELANGVALTGDPNRLTDDRYVISAQLGEASVVSADPGVVAEKTLLTVNEDGTVDIDRVVRSSLVAPGQDVLSVRQLEELGLLLREIDQSFPLDLGDHERDEVVLDVEFKIESSGELAVKQVRPFLRAIEGGGVVDPPPEFRLRIEDDTTACGAFVFGRDPLQEYQQKSEIRFRSGEFTLPAGASPLEMNLVDSLLVGPEQKLATAEGAGRVELEPAPGGERSRYRFRYEQGFRIDEGARYLLELEGLIFDASDEEAPDGQARTLSSEMFQGAVALRAVRVDDPLAPPILYTSCDLSALSLWRIDVQLEDGVRLELEERHEPPTDPSETGPAALVRAELLRSDGEQTVVTSYWDLVYSARRHNRGVRYWIELEPAARFPTAPVPVRVIEVVAPQDFAGPSVSFLDRNLQPVATSEVMDYARHRVEDPPAEPRFVRGDFNGDGAINVVDAVALLDYLFRDAVAPRCLDAGDADDNGRLAIADPVRLLDAVFRDGLLAPPGDFCGTDPTEDPLSCVTQSSCR